MVKVKPVQLGNNTRMSFGRINEVMEMPNLIEVQKNSYQWFLNEGLKEVFRDIAEITDYTGNLVLDFVGYRMDDQPKYTVAECKERDATYAAPMRVRARRQKKARARRDCGALPAGGCTLGRGERPAQKICARPLRWPTSTPLHCPRAGSRAGYLAHG